MNVFVDCVQIRESCIGYCWGWPPAVYGFFVITTRPFASLIVLVVFIPESLVSSKYINGLSCLSSLSVFSGFSGFSIFSVANFRAFAKKHWMNLAVSGHVLSLFAEMPVFFSHSFSSSPIFKSKSLYVLSRTLSSRPVFSFSSLICGSNTRK